MLCRLTRGRLKFKVYVLLSIVAVISISGYLFPQFRFYPGSVSTPGPQPSKTPRHLSKLITVVFRQFEEFENDVADSVQSFLSAYPNMPVVVVCESPPYPPFPFSATNETLRNVKVMSLELRLTAGPQDLDPLTHVFTEYILFVPDSTRVLRRTLQQAMTAATVNPSQAIAIGVGNSKLICQQVKWNYAEWTLQYNKDASAKICDAIHGQHALLIRTSLVRKLPQPFNFPFPESLYLQTAAKGVKVSLKKNSMIIKIFIKQYFSSILQSYIYFDCSKKIYGCSIKVSET